MKYIEVVVVILGACTVIGGALIGGMLARSMTPASPRPVPAPSAPAIRTPAPSPSIDEWKREHDQWIRRRGSEFARCDQAGGIPVLGYNGSVACLHADAVYFIGEPAPDFPELK